MLLIQNRRVPRHAQTPIRPEVGHGLARDLVVAGAHGGAGTSTLAQLLQPAWDLGAINHQSDRAHLRTEGRPLVIVARNNVAAAWHATRAVTALHETAVPLAALVIVADGAGSEPRDATARFALLEGRVGGVVRMPFVPALRLVDHVRAVSLPDKALNAVAQIRDLANAQPYHA